MENSKSKIIKAIAQELDCGNDCFYNIKTDKIIAISNFSIISDDEAFIECFGADLKRVEKNKAEFIKIEILESFESFKNMKRFVSQIADEQLQAELENILEQKKPFQNFKNRIDNSDYRQNWFDFKQNELEKIVETELNRGKASAQQRTEVKNN